MTSPEPRFYDFQNGKLTVSLTTACNLRCLMCPVIHRHSPRFLARTQALDVARFGAERGFGIIELSGGEPFLLPYIQELIEIACGNRASTVNVTTNATLLKPADIDFLANFPNLQIQVSFDGLGETHDAIRGKRGAFAAADAAVRALAAKGVHLALNTVVQQGNAHQLYDIYSHFSDIPYAWHGITPYEPGSPNIESIRIAPEQTAALTDALLRIKQAATAAQKPVALSDELIASFGERIATRDAAGGFAHPGLLCTVPRRAVFVQADGCLTPCIHLAWSKYLPKRARRLDRAGIAAIVDSDAYKNAIRRATGVNGCPGCSTMCYNFDPGFRRKMMSPSWSDALLFETAAAWEAKRRAASAKNPCKLHFRGGVQD